MDLGPGELLIILIIVIILFGPGRLANIGGELGKAIHNFRDGLQSPEKAEEASKPAEATAPNPSQDTP